MWRAAGEVEGWQAPHLDQALRSMQLCVYVSNAGGTVSLCKQAVCYFLAPVPPVTLEALSEAPLCHLEAVSKRKEHDVIFLTPPRVYMLEHICMNVKAGAREVNGCRSLYVCL